MIELKPQLQGKRAVVIYRSVVPAILAIKDRYIKTVHAHSERLVVNVLLLLKLCELIRVVSIILYLIFLENI